MIGTFINLYILVKIGFQTLIPLWLLFLLYFTSVAFPFILFKLTQTKDLIITFLAFPGVISLFLVLNFIFSKSPVHEQYTLVQKTDAVQNSTLIHLEKGTYEKYIGIRLFFDFTDIEYANTITYQFEKGLFGLKVLKGYEFSYP